MQMQFDDLNKSFTVLQWETKVVLKHLLEFVQQTTLPALQLS